jgi:hypothetical protein
MMTSLSRKGKQIMDEFKQEHWHLSKRFQVADMLTMLALAAGFAYYLNTVDARTALNSNQIKAGDSAMAAQIIALEARTAAELQNLKERDIEIRKEMNRHQDQVIGMLKDIQTKVDRHQEAHLNNP